MEDENLTIKMGVFGRLLQKIDQWASDDFYVPTFICASAAVDEVLSHLSYESKSSDAFLANKNDTSLKSDLLIVSGLINHKNLELIIKAYEQLVGRKYVVVIGGETLNPYGLNTYNIVTNLDEHIPVDLYIPGNPPKLIEIIKGLNKLKEIRR